MRQVYPNQYRPTPGFSIKLISFAFVLDEQTRHIQGEIPWRTFFVNDIVLVEETKNCINSQLVSIEALESYK